MPTLNKAKDETKTVLRWGGISFGIIIIFFMAIKFITFVKDLITPPPPPSASFGKLPSIPFPNQVKENITYSINTLTGYLPNFPDRAKVYKITTTPPTLLGLDKASEKVAQIGFISPGAQIADDTYQWVNQDPLQKSITMNIFSSNFSLSSPYLITPSLVAFSGTDDMNSAVDTANSFLSKMTLSPTDIDGTKTKITSYSIENSSLVGTSKISDTKIVRVDFFQNDIDKLPIYYENGIFSTLDFLIGKEGDNQEVVGATFYHRGISETSSTYAIKTAQEAYSELQKGSAYIASKPDNTVEFTINNVFLGYYIGTADQEFLMPIVIFEGNNNFVAYVSAVKDEWISN